MSMKWIGLTYDSTIYKYIFQFSTDKSMGGPQYDIKFNIDNN